jgi:hypothetical protein
MARRIEQMPIQNSLVETMVSLTRELYYDVAERHKVRRTEAAMDVREIEHRVAREGLGFLTKALPAIERL